MRHIQSAVLICFFYFMAGTLLAQTTFPYNGVYDQREGWYAFTNATIIQRAGQSLEHATLVIKNGNIVAVGSNVEIPAGAIVIDLEGKYIYPSFIDIYSNYGMPEAKPAGERPRQLPQMLSNKAGAFAWNEALKPEASAAAMFSSNEKNASGLRNAGFGIVATHQMDGISRGSSAIVALGTAPEHQMLLADQTAHHLSFSKGVSTQAYPSSLMGSIALLRQTYLDGQWYSRQTGETNLSLQAWNDLQNLPQIFETRSWQDALRALRIAEEFGVDYIIKGSGDEYQRLDALQASGATFIVPLVFPDAYDVSDPYDATLINLSQMRHWELAPSNAARMAEANISFALTANGHKDIKGFLPALRKAIQHGLSETDALSALTTTPARLLGISDHTGTLEAGKQANFIITDGAIFDKKTKIHHNWVQGKVHIIKTVEEVDLSGKYNLLAGASSFNMEISNNDAKIITSDTSSIKVKFSHQNGLVSLAFSPEGSEHQMRLSGVVDGNNWMGQGQDIDGNWINWKADYSGDVEKQNQRNKREKISEASTTVSQVTFPFEAYGWTTQPSATTVLIRNATVWTNEDDGILENTDVLLQNGKIASIGTNLPLPRGASIVDATGKHLTCGIIDEHSHAAISRGVNEGTQSSSAEVRIGDVINSTDINIYRQLAGGVTAIQALHGSANPIGGQSEILKLRWGSLPEEMKIDGAPEFIKFALGENVKQSNRSDSYRIQFPQTRMGVEQTFENYFTRARDYGEQLASGTLVRQDLELDALLEILRSERFITCHSYQQGEINMLMKVAERFDFRVNTFTHILEGYKVADKMAEHGVGGSSFSDWWAYKYEVIEAIPHNGALMHSQGVTVAFNSDDREMARRLNQEAAKAVLFGGVSEEDAWKFVTLNPAKLLHLDDQVGSIRTGKDADIVIWSDNPLSIYAQAEQTYVDGVKLYDQAEDAAMREAIAQERHALIQKMLEAKADGADTQRPRGRRNPHYHCDSVDDEGH